MTWHLIKRGERHNLFTFCPWEKFLQATSPLDLVSVF